MLKCMRCLNFAAAAALIVASPCEAQRVPGRDLLHYPLGTLAEAPSLALDTGDGFQNPAAIRLGADARLRGTVVALNTGPDLGISAQIAAVAVALPQRVTVGLSAARATITGVARTTTDPQPIGRDIPYNTFVLSLSAARQSIEHVTSGLAVRYRAGEVDGVRRSTVGLDAGVIVDRVFGYDARVGLSSFLWGPAAQATKDAAYSGAFDVRMVGPDSTHQARAGYSFTAADGPSAGHYVFVSGRYARWIGRVGVARSSEYGNLDTTLRLALGVRYARYTVGLSREESAGGFDPTYQFVLNGVFR